jgi:hypothetical protein
MLADAIMCLCRMTAASAVLRLASLGVWCEYDRST